MRLDTNVLAMSAIRNLLNTESNQGKALERLTSGKKINKAKDNAAGYAISDKMKNQIIRLKQASKNSLDAVSMIRVADASLDEVHSMLKRMRELSVQAATDSNILEDRKAIQNEIIGLTSEINRIANDTEFNRLKIFSKDDEEGFRKSSMDLPIQAGANAKQMVDVSFDEVSAFSLGISSIKGTIITPDNIDNNTPVENGVKVNDGNQDKLDDNFYEDKKLTDGTIKKRFGEYTKNSNGKYVYSKGSASKDFQPELDNKKNFVYVDEFALDVTSYEKANEAIGRFDKAIAQISKIRANLGATQNRFEQIVKIADSATENLTGAMSRIEDADMAEEMTEFVKNNILAQSGTSMLMQANQLPQMVLKILENN